MGRTYRRGGKEANHNRRREHWKRQKGTKRTKRENDNEKLPHHNDKSGYDPSLSCYSE
jgi:hypothetical protein